MNNFNKIFVPIALLSILIFTSCVSQKEIPADKTLEELKLTAYEYSAKGNYKASERYYNEVVVRFGSDEATLVGAKYEIAHLYIKQKKYKEAEPILNEVISHYSSANYNSNRYLPSQYLTLAQIDLQKIYATKK